MLFPQFLMILATTCLAFWVLSHQGHSTLSVFVESETRIFAPILYALAGIVRVRET